MKRLLLLLLLVCMAVPLQAQIAPYYRTTGQDDSLGTFEYWYPGWSRNTLFPQLSYKVPGSTLISMAGAIFHLSKNARSADTLIIEQRVIHIPGRYSDGAFIDGDTSWQAVTYMNMATGTLDTTGVIYLTKPLVKIQVYDLSPGSIVRLRTRTLRPSAQRVTYRAF